MTVSGVVDNVLGDLTFAAFAANGGSPLVLAPGASFSFTYTTPAALNVGTVVNTVTVSGQDDEGESATASDTHTLTVTDVMPSILVDKSGLATVAEGNTATYSFVITNTSLAPTDPVTITGVVDNVLGDLTFAALAANGGSPIVLAPGASFSFSYTTPAVLNVGTVVNTVTVSGVDDEGTPATATDNHTLTVTDVLPSITVDKSGPATIVEGSTATYAFTVTNTSVSTTDPVTLSIVMDDVLGDLTAAAQAAWVGQGHAGPIVLNQHDSLAFTFTTASVLNSGPVINTVTVVGYDDENSPAMADDSHTLVVVGSAPSILVDKSGPATVAEGNTATYTFTVTNTSPAATDPVTLTSVVDDVLGDLTGAALAANGGNPVVLAPGAGFSFSYTTPSVLDAGTIVNTVTVAGHDDENEPVTGSDSHTLTVGGTAPSILVDKSGPATVAEGNTATYTFTVTNTSLSSTDPLTLVSVLDSVLGDLTGAAVAANGGNPVVLAPGGSFTFSYTTPAVLNAGTVINTVTVLGVDDEGASATGNDTHTLVVTDTAPSILVDKAGPASVAEGNTATYTFTVTNTSMTSTDPVTLVSVTDDVLGSLTGAALAANGGNPIVLAPGASFAFSYTTPAALNAGTVVNTVTVFGQDDEGTPVSGADSHTLVVTDGVPAIAVQKTALQATYASVGTILSYSYTVTNLGATATDPVTLTAVVDDVIGDLAAAFLAANGGSPVLAAGASVTFTATYTVSQADLDAGFITNTIAVSAIDDENNPLAASDSATVFAVSGPSIQLIKTALTPTYSASGDVLSYAFTVTNTGNVTLTNVIVTDPVATVSGGPITLAPGQSDSTTFTATYTVSQADVDAGLFTNTAAAAGTPPSGPAVDDSATATVTALQSPSITLVKTALTGVYNASGDVLSYAFTVTNTGNVTLTNVIVTDPVATVSGGPITLAPGQSDATTFTATYTVSQADVDAGAFTNTATASGTPPSGPGVEASNTATVPAAQAAPAIGLVKTALTPTYSASGDVVTYTFTVTNTGNVTLTNVIVTDPVATVSGGPITLAPGQSDSTTFTATYTVSQADVDAGLFTNTATATGTPPSGPAVDDSATATVTALQSPSITLVKTALTGVYNASGDVLSYAFTVTNTGNVTLANVIVTDPVATVSGGPITLAPGQSDATTFTATYTVSQADVDAGAFTNTAAATGTPPSGPGVEASNTATVPAAQAAPAIGLVKTALTPTYSASGDVVTYTFTVTNTGNVTLTNVIVTDPVATVSGGPITLAPGQSDSTTFTATYTVSQADVDAGLFTNTAAAAGTPPSGPAVGDSATATVTALQSPSITLVKTALTGVYNASGDVLSYAFTVTNTGNVTLTNVIVTDPVATVSGGPITLAPGQSDSTTFTATYTVSQADVDAGAFTNTATASGTPPSGPGVEASNTATVPAAQAAPAIGLVKTALTPTYSASGDVVTYTFTVTNTGNVTLTNVIVTDPVATVSGGPITLAPGQSDSTTFTATYTVSQADVDAGLFTNTAAAAGTPPSGPAVGDSATATVTALQSPSITLVKTALTGVYNASGDVLSYAFTVTNTGNVTLTNVIVTDPVATVSGGPITLAPGQSDATTFTATYTVSQADVDAGAFTNTATASGTPPSGPGVEASNTATVPAEHATVPAAQAAPAIGLVKTALTPMYSASGDVVTYTFTVTNTGNVTLTNVVVTDPVATVSGGPITLAPGQSDATTFTATYTVSQADVDAGLFTNTAAAAGTPPSGPAVGDSATATVTALQSPSITLVKTALTGVYNASGDVLSYAFTVTNTGNVTLANVIVTDPVATVSGGPITLAPGQSDATTFTATYTVSQADVDAGAFTNTATASGTPPSGPGVEASNAATVPAAQAAEITVVKTAAPSTYAAIGDIITYTITVTNTGNVTLTNVVVSDPLTGLSETVPTLSPGASEVYHPTHTVNRQNLDAGSVLNTASATGTPPSGSDVTDTDDAIVSSVCDETAKVSGHVLRSGSLAPLANVPVTLIPQGATPGPVLLQITGGDGAYWFDGLPAGDYLVQVQDANLNSAYGLYPANSSLFFVTLESCDPEAHDFLYEPSAQPVLGDFVWYDVNANGIQDEWYDANGDGLVTQNQPDAEGRVIYQDWEWVDLNGDGSHEGPENEGELNKCGVGNVLSSNIRITGPAGFDDSQLVGLEGYWRVRIDTANPWGEYTAELTVDAPLRDAALALAATGLCKPLPVKVDVAAVSAKASGLGCIASGVSSKSATLTPSNPEDLTLDFGLYCADFAPGLAVTKTAVPSSYSTVGETITYSIVVSNTGNVAITGIVVADPLTGLSATLPSLAAGASHTYTQTYTITQADIDAGSVVNVASASGSDQDGDPVGDTDDETVTAEQHPAVAIEKNAVQASYDASGDVLSYTFTVTNTGNVTLTNVIVTDPQATVTGGPITLAPGRSDSTTFTATYVVTQSDLNAGAFTNTATATGAPPTGPAVGDTDSVTVPAVTAPSLALVKNAVQSFYDSVGDVLAYTFTVTNTGNVTLTNVIVTDPQATVTGGPITLAPGQSDSTTFTAAYVVTQSDLNAGAFTNTATATGAPPSGPAVGDTDSATVPAAAGPSLALVKNAVQSSYDSVGDVLAYTFTVTNTGNVTLTNVMVTDPQATVTGGPITLAPGQSSSTAFTATYTVKQSDVDAGAFTNTATATGAPPSGPTVGDTDSVTVPSVAIASIRLVKTALEPTYTLVGDVLHYTFTVTNTGSVTLANVTVTDPQATVAGGPITLAPGATDSTTFTAAHTVTQADLDASSFTNTATAVGTPPTGPAVSDSDSATVPATSGGSPAVRLLKTALLPQYSAVGQVITYAFTVENIGTAALTNVMVTDPQATVTGGPIALAAGASDSTTFTAAHTVTQADMDAGTFTNTAVVTGTAPGGAEVTADDSETVTAVQSPAIALVKTPITASYGVAGQALAYAFTVTNTGNVTLTGVMVTDPQATVSGGPITLAPGQSDSTAFTAVHVTTQAEVDAGSFTNTATVAGTPPSGPAVTDTDSATLPASQATASIQLVKSALQSSYDAVGATLAYTFTVTNTGTVTLTNVTVTDPKATVSGGPITLAPGASDSTTFSAVHSVTQADLDAGAFTNAAAVTGTPPSGPAVSDTASATVPASQQPAVALVKSGSPTVYGKVGQTITYTFTVTNTGNVTLTNAQISDILVDVSGGPIGSLAPGQSDTTTFTASYTVTQADIDRGKIVNIATVTADNLVGPPVTATDEATVLYQATEGEPPQEGEGEGEGEPGPDDGCNCQGIDWSDPGAIIVFLLSLLGLILGFFIFGGGDVRLGKG